MSSCGTQLDTDFINYNQNRSESESSAVSEISADVSEQPSSAPETKPSGFVLNPSRVPPTNPYIDDLKESSAEFIDTSFEVPDTPDYPVQPVMLSSGLKAALSTCGRTTTDGINFVAYSPVQDANGGVRIIHIASNITSGKQKEYYYYESAVDYQKAKAKASTDSCNDAVRMVLQSVSRSSIFLSSVTAGMTTLSSSFWS